MNNKYTHCDCKKQRVIRKTTVLSDRDRQCDDESGTNKVQQFQCVGW